LFLRPKNTTTLCFYILQDYVVLGGEKARVVSKGEGEVVPLIWAHEHEEVWGLNEFLNFAVKWR
jgi:hypothetical protein